MEGITKTNKTKQIKISNYCNIKGKRIENRRPYKDALIDYFSMVKNFKTCIYTNYFLDLKNKVSINDLYTLNYTKSKIAF